MIRFPKLISDCSRTICWMFTFGSFFFLCSIWKVPILVFKFTKIFFQSVESAVVPIQCLFLNTQTNGNTRLLIKAHTSFRLSWESPGLQLLWEVPSSLKQNIFIFSRTKASLAVPFVMYRL